MTGISHLFRKRPKRRKPVVLSCTVVIEETHDTGCALRVMTSTGVGSAILLCEGESVKIELREVPA